MTSNLNNHIEVFTKARYWAVKKFPYFSRALYGLILYPDPNLPPAAIAITENFVLVYNPNIVDHFSVTDIGYILVHEVNHVLRGHNKYLVSQSATEKALRNIAMDLCINQDISNAISGYKVEGLMYPEVFKVPENLNWIEYYNILRQMHNDESNTSEQAQGLRDLVAKYQTGGCGSGAGNAPEWEPRDIFAGRSEREIEIIRRKTANDILAHKNNRYGNVGDGGFIAWAEEFNRSPKIPWQVILRNAITNAYKVVISGNTSTTYARPSKRQGSIGYGHGKSILPRTISYKPNVWVVVDTSGSMFFDGELSDAVSEACGIIQLLGRVTFVSGDCNIGEVVQARSIHDIKNRISGGGGTDFRPPFIYAMKQPAAARPDILIYLTDGMGPAPEKAPPFKTIWCLFGRYAERPAPWGEVVLADTVKEVHDKYAENID